MYEKLNDYKGKTLKGLKFLLNGISNQKIYGITNEKGSFVFTSSDEVNYKCVEVVILK